MSDIAAYPTLKALALPESVDKQRRAHADMCISTSDSPVKTNEIESQRYITHP